jgi:hypothetical protein
MFLIFFLKKFSPIYYQTISAGLYGSVMLMVPIVPSFILLAVLNSLIGLADGMYYASFLLVAKDASGSAENINLARVSAAVCCYCLLIFTHELNR